MTLEDQQSDHKSLRIITGRMADWDAVVRVCVCFVEDPAGDGQITYSGERR